MKIASIEVRNFRSIKSATIFLEDATVIIGENNSGKTALIEALRISLSHRWGRRGTGFSENDFQMDDVRNHPSKCDPISITVRFSERRIREWPDSVVAALADIIQQDPISELYSINMRAECTYNTTSNEIEPVWDFLAADGTPLKTKRSQSTNLSNFFSYIPIFSLSALRDATKEFGVRSQFWGALLKAVKVTKQKEIEDALAELNANLAASADKFTDIQKTLASISEVIRRNAAHKIEVRAVPLTVWDLLENAQVYIQARKQDPSLPIERHGNGVQSLAIIFLLQAFIEHSLGVRYSKGAEAFTLLEEPEAHLHPQASRALWAQIDKLLGQKIITTHSPHFLENVPLRSIRLLRRTDTEFSVHHLPESYSTRILSTPDLKKYMASKPAGLHYEPAASNLTVNGKLSEETYRKIMACFTVPETREENTRSLKGLYDRSQSHISDAEITAIQTSARRMRGEIFFAKAWLLCEGQADHYLLHAFADACAFQLDPNNITVIDYQNGGSAGLFASLARAFGFPWQMICDKDRGGQANIKDLENCGFDTKEIAAHVEKTSEKDLEADLVKSGLRALAVDTAKELYSAKGTETDEELVTLLQKDKLRSAANLSARIRAAKPPSSQWPGSFRKLFEKLKGAVA